MPGYIDNTTNEGLFEGYSAGRNAWKGDSRLSGSGQWSAVNDDRVCDFCSWADDQIFHMDQVEWDPPVHWGCRCLVGYILTDEDPGPSTWGDGPPKNTFPPGTRAKTRSASIQDIQEIRKRRRAAMGLKPTSGKQAGVGTGKARPKVGSNKGRSVGTEWQVDKLKSKADIEKFLQSSYGITSSLDGMSLASARDMARAVEKFRRAYPEMRGSISRIYTEKSGIGSFEVKKLIASGDSTAVTNYSTSTKGPASIGMTSKTVKVTKTPTNYGFVSDGGQEGTMWHELGHVVENWMTGSPGKQNWLREVQTKFYKNSKTLMEADISKYATESSTEFFGEFFHLVNRQGGINAWTTNTAARQRLREILKYFQDQGLPIAETQLGKPKILPKPKRTPKPKSKTKTAMKPKPSAEEIRRRQALIDSFKESARDQ